MEDSVLWFLIPFILAGIVTISIVTLETIKKLIDEIKLKKQKRYIAGRIEKMYKEGNYKVVEVGLIDDSGNKEKLIIKGEEVGNDIHVGQKIPV
jgi:hypothetical protein